jgi:hypothetical protein
MRFLVEILMDGEGDLWKKLGNILDKTKLKYEILQSLPKPKQR